MKNVFALVMCAALLAAVAAPAAAETPHVCFRALDTDADGQVSLEEFSRAYGEDAPGLFATADENGDGVLVHNEYHDFLGHGAVGQEDTEEEAETGN